MKVATEIVFQFNHAAMVTDRKVIMVVLDLVVLYVVLVLTY